MLEELLEQEEALNDAKLKERGRQSKLDYLNREIRLKISESEYLRKLTKEVQEKLVSSQPVPSSDDVLQQFTAFQDSLRSEDSLERSAEPDFSSLVVPEDRDVEADLACTRLYYRVAQLVHPDPPEGQVTFEHRTAWFVTLRQHRWDRLYLEAMEAAFSSVTISPGKQVSAEEEIEHLFERLFTVKDIQDRLRTRIGSTKADVGASKVHGSVEMDNAITQREELLHVQNIEIDESWRLLNSRLMEPESNSAHS